MIKGYLRVEDAWAYFNIFGKRLKLFHQRRPGLRKASNKERYFIQTFSNIKPKTGTILKVSKWLLPLKKSKKPNSIFFRKVKFITWFSFSKILVSSIWLISDLI